MQNCNRLLDLTGPLQLGSFPVSFNAEQFDAPDFEGCISDLYLDNEMVDLDSAIANHLTTVGCPPKISRCHLFPCKKGGMFSEYYCNLCHNKDSPTDVINPLSARDWLHKVKF